MNIHNKLLSLGFKKIEPHKLEYDSSSKFTPYSDLKIPAPKWHFTYILNFSKDVKVWAIVVKHTDITIYLEKELPLDPKRSFVGNRTLSKFYKKSNIHAIYSSNTGKYPPITSLNSIIQVLPTDIKRDVILSKLFG